MHDRRNRSEMEEQRPIGSGVRGAYSRPALARRGASRRSPSLPRISSAAIVALASLLAPFVWRAPAFAIGSWADARRLAARFEEARSTAQGSKPGLHASALTQTRRGESGSLYHPAFDRHAPWRPRVDAFLTASASGEFAVLFARTVRPSSRSPIHRLESVPRLIRGAVIRQASQRVARSPRLRSLAHPLRAPPSLSV
jgi:hypothetical protein